MTVRRYPSVPTTWTDVRDHLHKMADRVNDLLSGRSNNHYALTLAPNETETELESTLVGSQTSVFFGPRDAAAAAAPLWYEIEIGKVTFHHDASPDPRNFSVLLIG